MKSTKRSSSKNESESEEIPEVKLPGTLFVVSTPIGNDDDITLRAIKVLKTSDIVVCEEAKIGARFLHKMNLASKMELLNEQNEFTKAAEIIEYLEAGQNISLISDCGTPVFADPGYFLVQTAIKKNLNVVVVPGASSIMTAIVRSGFNIDQFIYAGFLSRKIDERIMQIKRLSQESRTVVIFETPYRLMPFLEAATSIMPDRNVYIGCNLTMPFETHHYGTFKEIHEKFAQMKFKGEFVVVIDGVPIGQTQTDEEEEEFFAQPETSGRPEYKSTYSRDNSYSKYPGRSASSGNYNRDRTGGRREYSGGYKGSDNKDYLRDNRSEGQGSGYNRDYNRDKPSGTGYKKDYNKDYNRDKPSGTGYKKDYNRDKSSGTGYKKDYNKDSKPNYQKSYTKSADGNSGSRSYGKSDYSSRSGSGGSTGYRKDKGDSSSYSSNRGRSNSQFPPANKVYQFQPNSPKSKYGTPKPSSKRQVDRTPDDDE